VDEEVLEKPLKKKLIGVSSHSVSPPIKVEQLSPPPNT